MNRNVAFAVACLLFLTVDAAGDCSVRLSGRSPASGSVICFQTTTYPDDRHIIAAAARWNNECNGGDAIPSMDVGGCTGSSIVIGVKYVPGISTNTNRTCGVFQANSQGALTGGNDYIL